MEKNLYGFICEECGEFIEDGAGNVIAARDEKEYKKMLPYVITICYRCLFA